MKLNLSLGVSSQLMVVYHLWTLNIGERERNRLVGSPVIGPHPQDSRVHESQRSRIKDAYRFGGLWQSKHTTITKCLRLLCNRRAECSARCICGVTPGFTCLLSLAITLLLSQSNLEQPCRLGQLVDVGLLLSVMNVDVSFTVLFRIVGIERTCLVYFCGGMETLTALQFAIARSAIAVDYHLLKSTKRTQRTLHCNLAGEYMSRISYVVISGRRAKPSALTFVCVFTSELIAAQIDRRTQ